MMQDPTANFFDVQRAFNTYWQGRQRVKGDGWKIFKRWEWFMEKRVNPDGSRQAPDAVIKAYQGYQTSTKGLLLTSSPGNWTEVGPVYLPGNGTSQPNGLGRVNAVAFHPTNSNIIYVAAPSGGLWKTTNGGSTWNVLTDSLPTLGVSSILIHPTNTNIIYIGTGDRDAGDAPGLGVMRSTDGGLSWSFSNSGMGNCTVGMMIMDPTNLNTILAATSGGIFRSTNGGSSWTLTSSNYYHYKDIRFKPGDPSIVYASASGHFYRSTNSGVSWSLVSTGLPNTGRLAIGVSQADSNYVYAVVGSSSGLTGVYRSTNSGVSFSTMATSPNILGYSSTGNDSRSQAWYDLCIAVDPNNINTLYVGGINIWKSTNGGSTWTLNAHWTGSGAPAIHADIHSLDFNPHNGRLYSGNDGGIYYTSNGGSSWIDVSSGLGISQVYKIGQSASQKDLVINGYQDNGTAIYNNGTWTTEIGGDGMECIVDPTNTNYLYGELYYGNIRRSTNGGSSFSNIAGDNINGINETGGWITPYILHVTDPNTMVVGYKNIWRSTNIKASSSSSVNWTKLTNNLGGSNSSNINDIEQSEANPNILYFSRSDNKMFRSDNFNNTSPSWTDISSGLPFSSTPKDIEAHPNNQNIVYLIIGNNIYKSTNKGASWSNISGNLPNISLNCIVFDSSSTNEALYVGTDAGVYYKDNSLSIWISFMNGLPIEAEVTELEIYYNSNSSNSSIRAATYGRGLWESPLYALAVLSAGFTPSTSNSCVGTQVSFTNTSQNATSYIWKENGVVFSTSQSTSRTFNSAGSYLITLIVSDGVTIDSTGHTITINPLPDQASTPSGSTVLCTNPSNTSYVTSGAIDASSYEWTITPSGAGIISGTVTSAIVDWNNTFSGTASITVRGVNNCGNGIYSNSITVHIDPLPGQAATPSGNTTLCMNSPNSTYSTSGANDATSYEWTITPVSSGTISGTGTSAVVNWNNTFSGTASISVRGVNNCGNGIYSNSITVHIDPLPGLAATPIGNTSLCENPINTTYSTLGSSNTTSYYWSLSPTSSGIINGSGTSAVVDWNDSFTGNAYISVQGINNCGSGTPSNDITITIYANPSTPVITQSNDTLFSSSGTGNQWYDQSGMINGANDSFYIPVAAGNYYVMVTNSNGCYSQSDVFPYVLTSESSVSEVLEINIYPNPVNDILKIESNNLRELQFTLIDLLGYRLFSARFIKNYTLNIEPYPCGIYFIEIWENSHDEKRSLYKIIKK
ncbi:T9SS type A sorting domain-containing protein [candidate division KSB1 bacterium]